MITVYTLPACVQCDSTKRYLKKHLVDFTEVDLSQDSEAMERIKGWGYSQAPVVQFGEQHWSGFRLERLDSVVKADRTPPRT